MATILTSTPRLAEFVLSEASGQRSRENIVVNQTGTAIKSGTVLSRVDTNSANANAVATAGNVGNPTFGVIAIDPATAKPGAYILTFIAPTKFNVEDPEGLKVGNGTVGAPFNKGGLSFTAVSGSMPAAAGDEFTLTLANGSGNYIPYVAGGTAGSADAILYSYLPAATGSVKTVGFVRDFEANRAAVVGCDALAIKQLEAHGIRVRGVYPD